MKTALVTFVDNIATLAIENCLIRPLGSVFNSQRLSSLSDEQIHNLASESPEIQLERKTLEQELEKLQAGLQALNALKIESLPSSCAPQPRKQIPGLENASLGDQNDSIDQLWHSGKSPRRTIWNSN